MLRRLSSIFLLLIILYVAFFPSLMNGSLNMQLTFTPTSGTDQFHLYFDELKVHQARALDESGWILINFDKKPIDIANSESYVYMMTEGSNIPVGRYDRISLSIAGASLEVDEILVELKVQKDTILIQEDFSILKNSAKDLTLDFEIDMERTIATLELVYEAKILELE